MKNNEQTMENTMKALKTKKTMIGVGWLVVAGWLGLVGWCWHDGAIGL
jgi:hypothetical protein